MFSFFKNKYVPEDLIQHIEDTLIGADFGMETTTSVIAKLKKLKINNTISQNKLNDLVKQILLDDFPKLENFIPLTKGLNIFSFVGLNGAGKTTSIAKFTNIFKEQGHKILLVPADTFRAGATQQLNLWAQDLGVEIFLPTMQNQTVSTIVYLATEYAIKNNFTMMLVDTSGRLDNNIALMDELTKIQNTIKKLQPSFANNVLVLDSTLGSYSVEVAKNFASAVSVCGVIITKLDGVAKGGFVFNLTHKIKKPIYFLGNGEAKQHLHPFDIENYIDNLFK